MILSNITVPLLGLVDTAVIGHLDSAHFLAGIALGSSSISVLFWLASFLRMSTTGVIAQSSGEQDNEKLVGSLYTSVLIAICFALSLILLSPFLLQVIASLSNASNEVFTQAKLYFQIRVFSAPAAMLNLVLLGFMLGMHYGRGPFYLVLFTNVVNIVLDVLFVIGFEWGVAGAAWASLIADYAALGLSILLTINVANKHGLELKFSFVERAHWLSLLTLNRDIFVRSLILQLCFSFMTFYGARLGEVTLAANAVLLNFLMLVSFAMDGIAYASEAKVGTAKGRADPVQLQLWVKISLFWGALFALLYSMVFYFFGDWIIGSLTTIPEVIAAASIYLPWLVALPLVAMSCFLFDGIFVGLTRAKEMRNSMLISALFGFFLPFWLTHSLGNHALWLAMSCFMGLRGLTLAYKYYQLSRQGALLA
ncbi:MATE family efflux transporter [Pseudoalteromonas peptidolytica]|uniref:Multidrug resistance protein, MATE family n=1 Tax=Pseudoalteromonas peptidolytica F12-50-A1 TaxID=1315280 RepID=A0A8I0MXS8_9GAMM|nr:MATE family efflux transporter [Pseudoalteromonas peptidolytica]MBE0347796.1 multidrug resistance protein, MATE family [Pseudoalteromonas peptidolytica F12-50-A1]NLR16817.1 MATE family efflux transporter [Pseudoalteromonas peptidolytica]GEK09726.1 MATE family efflux transporter [Pseudoalteromonas peptidolytica]